MLTSKMLSFWLILSKMQDLKQLSTLTMFGYTNLILYICCVEESTVSIPEKPSKISELSHAFLKCTWDFIHRINLMCLFIIVSRLTLKDYAPQVQPKQVLNP